MKKKILIIEDDKHIAELVRLHLADLGHQLTVCHDGTLGWDKYQKIVYDLVILDIMLPGMDGLEICKHIRSENEQYTPILMLTSKTTELDRVLGLELIVKKIIALHDQSVWVESELGKGSSFTFTLASSS